MLNRTIAGLGSLGLSLMIAAACSDGTPTEPLNQEAVEAPGGSAATPSAAASGQRQATVLRADLDELNDSGADGQVTVVVKNDGLMVTLNARGVSSSLPHAQHIHIGGTNSCPTASLAGADGLISTLEGAPAYGAVQVSLTTEGDVSAASGLAVDRFPVANGAGVVTYQRRFDLPTGVTAEEVMDGVIVVHGISELFGDPAAYDGAPRSSLTNALPLEATIPTLCGKLTSPGNS